MLFCPLDTNKVPETDLKLRVSVYNQMEEKVSLGGDAVVVWMFYSFIYPGFSSSFKIGSNT